VIEAMASGCPVITTNHGSLAEAAGDAALLIDGQSVEEMRDALLRIQDNSLQKSLRTKGFEQAKSFCWISMSNRFRESIEQLAFEAEDHRYDAFFQDWRALRMAQADHDIVDTGVTGE
jgi:glycosyltransferase involved in cell wall biosynthesis